MTEEIIKLMEIRSEISRLDSNRVCGPGEFAEIIWKINSISPFLNLSKQGLRNLVHLAFKISLQKEETRYPRFQVYVPASGLEIEESDLSVYFEPPINLDVSTLYRIGTGVFPRPYALFVWESDSQLYAYGIIKIEIFKARFTDPTRLIHIDLYAGLVLSIEEPGSLNVSLYNTHGTIAEKLTLRYGKIEVNYDPNTALIVQPIYNDIAENIIKKHRKGNQSSSLLGNYIGNVWSYILSLSVYFKHGGQFIFLPSGSSVDDIQAFLDVKHRATQPDLGAQISALVCYSTQNKVSPHHHHHPFTGKRLSEDNFSHGFKQGLNCGLFLAEEIQDKVQFLFDSARAVAKLSTADGCVIFDRSLQLLGFKGVVSVEQHAECVALEPDFDMFKDNERKVVPFDIKQYGTRHRSAAIFCSKVPHAVVFVVSQDGDIRLFIHMNDGKVGICGPFRPLPGLSPTIVHS